MITNNLQTMQMCNSFIRLSQSACNFILNTHPPIMFACCNLTSKNIIYFTNFVTYFFFFKTYNVLLFCSLLVTILIQQFLKQSNRILSNIPLAMYYIFGMFVMFANLLHSFLFVIILAIKPSSEKETTSKFILRG